MLLAPGNYLVRGVAYSGPVWGSYLVRFRKEDIRTWADAGLIAPFEFNLPSQAQPTRMLRTYRQGCMFDPHFQMGFFLSFHLCCAPDANLLGYLRDYVMAGEPLPVSEGVTPDIDEQMYFWDFLRNVAERKRIKGLVPQMNPKEMMRVVRCENIAELMRHSPCPTATVEELIS
jgi:hypothetical protein